MNLLRANEFLIEIHDLGALGTRTNESKGCSSEVRTKARLSLGSSKVAHTLLWQERFLWKITESTKLAPTEVKIVSQKFERKQGCPPKVRAETRLSLRSPSGCVLLLRQLMEAKAIPREFDVNADLYKVLMKELAQTLERQFAGNAEFRAAGMVINTMGWIEGVGYELLLHAIDAFNANVVLVLGQEKLCSMLNDVLKNKPNVDVVSRNAKVRQKARSYRIREYFYGLANDLSPHSNITRFSDLSVYRIGGGPQAPRSALPIGAELAANPT